MGGRCGKKSIQAFRGPHLESGLARVACTVEWILREAELGLIMAQASGGGQVRRGAIPRRAEMPSYGLGEAHR